MIKNVKYLIGLAILLCAMRALAMGSRPEPMTEYTELSQGNLRFYLQNSFFMDSLGQSNIEFSYSLSMDQLQFIADGQSYKAGYVISIIIYDGDGQQVTGDSWERTFKISDYQQLQRGDSILADTLILPLPPGEYRAKILCRDANSQRVGEFSQLIRVPYVKDKNYIGGLRFERNYHGRPVPWPSRIYGYGAGPITFRFNVYCDSADGISARIRLEAVRDQKNLWEKRQTISGKASPQLAFTIPTDSLADGNYRLEISLVNPQDRELWRNTYRIMVQNPELITKGGFEERIAEVELIARKSEFDSLRRAEPGQRDSLWKIFWKSRDPTPDTEKNEFREAYYEKITYANENFGTSIKPGWRTDMGQIYIKYGQPDEIEKHPFEINTQPYEIWYYYERGYKFIFVDRHGFGEYKLINSQ